MGESADLIYIPSWLTVFFELFLRKCKAILFCKSHNALEYQWKISYQKDEQNFFINIKFQGKKYLPRNAIIMGTPGEISRAFVQNRLEKKFM